MSPHSRVVVVGAGIAGVQAVESLRAAGYDGHLTVVDADTELPYDRPPLSKDFLCGALDEEDLHVWSLDRVAELDIDLRLATTAVGLDTDRKRLTVRSQDGTPDGLAYDQLVLGLGVTARRPAGVADLDGVCVLRSLADARRLRDRLRRASGPVVVVGGGFIGGEVASSARKYDLDVTIVEAGQSLLPQVLTPDMARPLARLHEQHGVRVMHGQRLTALRGADAVESVELADGTSLPAAVVVLGLGGTPTVEWLKPSGIELGDGIHVDAQLRTSAPDVYAIGDAARWHDDETGSPRRLEHWTCARRQGTHVAQSLLGTNPTFHEIPYIWTDQHGGKLQIAGAATGDEVRFIDGGPDDTGYVALVRRDDGLAGVVALNRARDFMKFRRLLTNSADWATALSDGTTSPSAKGSACAS
jgi:NADPH-dependent 2,4-dienoyl-CoA reductase/sulfur reductase-like enzyme